MSQQLINVGTLPNDLTGDPLRTAFSKINNNFAELSTVTTANTANNSPNQVIFSTLASTFTQATIKVTSRNLTNVDLQSTSLSVVKMNDGANVLFSSYGNVAYGNALTTLNMDITSGNVRILCSPLVNANLTHTTMISKI
jgi:hypothetical protein